MTTEPPKSLQAEHAGDDAPVDDEQWQESGDAQDLQRLDRRALHHLHVGRERVAECSEERFLRELLEPPDPDVLSRVVGRGDPLEGLLALTEDRRRQQPRQHHETTDDEEGEPARFRKIRTMPMKPARAPVRDPVQAISSTDTPMIPQKAGSTNLFARGLDSSHASVTTRNESIIAACCGFPEIPAKHPLTIV